MKALGVVPLYPPQSRVGAWLATHECLAGLVKAGHSVTVIRYLASGDAYDVDGVTVLPGTADLDELTAEADAVIAHLGGDGRAADAAHKHGKPLVIMVHGQAVRPKTNGAALVVYNSDASRDWLGWEGVTVHPPLYPERFRTTPGDCVTQVNLSEDKGGGLFWLLSRVHHDRQFLGVKGGYGSQITRAGPNVEFLRTTPDMRAVFSRTRVLLMPSRFETWGMVGLEAMSSGIPVIAHPTPGLVESLGDAGIFVDRNDFAGWREAIRSMFDPEVWTEASGRALERVAELDAGAEVSRFVSAVEALCP